MNCKQGDLAIVIRSVAGNEGKIVKCLRFIGDSGDPFDADKDLWEVDAMVNVMSFNVFNEPLGIHKQSNLISDSQLKPLRGDLMNDETTTSKELEAA